MSKIYIFVSRKRRFSLSPSWLLICLPCLSATSVPVRTVKAHSSCWLMFMFTSGVMLLFCVFPHPDQTYSGVVANDKLFKTANGKSFKCKSENQLLMSSLLQVKLVPLQLQAFTLDKGKYGKGGRTPLWDCADMLRYTQLVPWMFKSWSHNLVNTRISVQVAVLTRVLFLYFPFLLHLSCLPVSEVECWADYNKRIIPIVVGAVVVGLILIAGLIYLFIRDNSRQGYDSLWELRTSNNSGIAEKFKNISLKILLCQLHFTCDSRFFFSGVSLECLLLRAPI